MQGLLVTLEGTQGTVCWCKPPFPVAMAPFTPETLQLLSAGTVLHPKGKSQQQGPVLSPEGVLSLVAEAKML